MNSLILTFYTQRFPPYIIDLMSYEGLRNFSITFILILFFLWSGRYLEEKNKIIFAKAISVLTLIITVSNHIIDVNNGNWDIYENLPLHLCSISNLIACFVLFIPKNQKLFTILYKPWNHYFHASIHVLSP
jgi:uncharacterized membrane protein YwaF